jgi:hypothetical protein
MTDSEIAKNIAQVRVIIVDCDKSEHSEVIRLIWATCAATWCMEIADEMRRRIGK